MCPRIAYYMRQLRKRGVFRHFLVENGRFWKVLIHCVLHPL